MKNFKIIVSVCFCFILCGFLLMGCGKKSMAVSINGELKENLSSVNAGEAVVCELENGGENSENTADDLGNKKPEYIYVYICGEIEFPGVYELNKGSRLFELINKAGGLTAMASDTYLNQAVELSDGAKIYVPSKEEAAERVVLSPDASMSAEGGGAAGSAKALLVNINTASESELQGISGIGASRAADIVKYREENGAFGSIEDIKNVSGIKDGLFSKIKDQITVGSN